MLALPSVVFRHCIFSLLQAEFAINRLAVAGNGGGTTKTGTGAGIEIVTGIATETGVATVTETAIVTRDRGVRGHPNGIVTGIASADIS